MPEHPDSAYKIMYKDLGVSDVIVSGTASLLSLALGGKARNDAGHSVWIYDYVCT